jgi:hypothetical protein
MAWVTITKSVVTGFAGWQYDDAATTANTYPASMHLSRANGSDASGIRTFDPPGATPAQKTYIKCRKVNETEASLYGELSKTYYDARP